MMRPSVIPLCPAMACPPRTSNTVNAVNRNNVFTALMTLPLDLSKSVEKLVLAASARGAPGIDHLHLTAPPGFCRGSSRPGRLCLGLRGRRRFFFHPPESHGIGLRVNVNAHQISRQNAADENAHRKRVLHQSLHRAA